MPWWQGPTNTVYIRESTVTKSYQYIDTTDKKCSSNKIHLSTNLELRVHLSWLSKSKTVVYLSVASCSSLSKPANLELMKGWLFTADMAVNLVWNPELQWPKCGEFAKFWRRPELMLNTYYRYLLYYNMFPSTQLTFKYSINAKCFDLWQSSSGWSKNCLIFHRFYFVNLGSQNKTCEMLNGS